MINNISFCGIDGSGKTTQMIIFKDYLKSKGIDSEIVKPDFYPYEQYKEEFKSEEILCLGTAFDFLRYNGKLSRLTNKKVRLYDRHKICYLAMAYAFKVNNLEQLGKIYSVIKSPDIIVYFDTDVSVSMKRILSRGKTISNRENQQILSRFKEGYEYFLCKERHSAIITINSNKSIEEIQTEIIEKVYSKINK